MIALTNPALVNSVLGGTDTVGYDKFVLSRIQYDTGDLSARCTIEITSTAAPTMQPLHGSLLITTANATLEIQVPQLDFYRKITLTGPQNSALQGYIRDTQNSLETGLINIGLIDGTQQTGS